jgi:hypothetical protein
MFSVLSGSMGCSIDVMRRVEDAREKVAMEAKGGEGAPAIAQPGKTRKRPFFSYD